MQRTLDTYFQKHQRHGVKKIISKTSFIFHIPEKKISSHTRKKDFFTSPKIIFLHRPEDEDDDEEVAVPPPKMNYKRRSLDIFLIGQCPIFFN